MLIPATFRIREDHLNALQERAIRLSAVRGKTVSWARLLREIIEKALMEPESAVSVQTRSRTFGDEREVVIDRSART
jgi:hypothetical protein